MARKKAPNGMGSLRKKTVKGKVYFEGRYWDPILNKQKSVSATSEAECKKKLQQALAAITTGSFVTPDRITCERWFSQWMESKNDTWQPGTRAAYKNRIDLHILPRIGKIRLQDVRRIHLQKLIDDMRKAGASTATLRAIKTTLCSCFSDAVRLEMLSRNPAHDLALPAEEKPDPIAMDENMVKAFTAAAAGNKYFNVFMIQLETGCRISEVLGLQWRSVDFKTGQVDICGQIESRDGAPHFKPRTKTGKNRSLYLPPYALEFLKAERRKQNANRLRAGEAWQNQDGLVFTREDGSPLNHNVVNLALKTIAKALGHPEWSTHTLRKTFVSREIAAGTDVKTVSALAGHSSIDITLQTYAATTDDLKRDAAARRQQRHDEEEPDS